MSPYYPDLDYRNCERAFRKLDDNGDGRINFNEFLRAMRPIYCYRKYEHYVPQASTVTQSKVYYTERDVTNVHHVDKSNPVVKKHMSTQSLKVNQKQQEQKVMERVIQEERGVQERIMQPERNLNTTNDRPVNVYSKWDYSDTNTMTRSKQFNDKHWVLEHPAYWSPGPWWNYPVAYEQQYWLDHPYHSHQKLMQDQAEQMNQEKSNLEKELLSPKLKDGKKTPKGKNKKM